MIDLLYYTLSCVGLMSILKYGSILSAPRSFLTSKSKYLEELFKCSLCLGFWVGFLTTLFIYFLDNAFWSSKFYLFPLYSAVICWSCDSIIGILSYSEKYIARQANK